MTAPTDKWNDWNRKIIEEFRANEGRVGGPFEGAPMILVHHTGAKSGSERVTPLVRFPEDEAHTIIIASKAGAPTNPDWFHNLVAHPDATIEVASDTIEVAARVAADEVRDRIWSKQKADYPGFADYESKTDRTIPVVVLTRRP